MAESSGSLRVVRNAALTVWLAAALCSWPERAAACTSAAPCVDAEPLWHSPSAERFVLVSDPATPVAGGFASSAVVGFRLEPAVLIVPSPSAEGREINLISHATDLSLGARLGLGNGMEVTLALPAGLYQRGAGIKGVTHQSAPSISGQSLHDPRLGFAFVALARAQIGIKMKLELKLPLGDAETLAGETGPVLGSSIAALWRPGRFFFGTELGARLRNPRDFFGRRIGTQLVAALGAGYALPRPRLAFTLESYLAESLVARESAADRAAEWLVSSRFTPQALPPLTVGLAGGTGLALSEAGSGVGTPVMRLLAFARWAPASD